MQVLGADHAQADLEAAPGVGQYQAIQSGLEGLMHAGDEVNGCKAPPGQLVQKVRKMFALIMFPEVRLLDGSVRAVASPNAQEATPVPPDGAIWHHDALK